MKSFRHYFDEVELSRWDQQHESDYRVMIANYDRRAYIVSRVAMMCVNTDHALMLARNHGIR
jgi:hypothetical protein